MAEQRGCKKECKRCKRLNSGPKACLEPSLDARRNCVHQVGHCIRLASRSLLLLSV